MKEVQVAKVQCGRDYRISKRGDEFRIYRIWSDLREGGYHDHKTLVAKCETIAEALMVVAHYMKTI